MCFLFLLSLSLHIWIVSSHHVLFEDVRLPAGWTAIGAPAQNRQMLFRIALRARQQNLDLFEQTLSDVSNPYHSKYGRHLTRQEVKDMLNATEAASVVHRWLLSSGIGYEDIENDEEWINFKTTIYQMEKILNTTFYSYQDPTSNYQVIRTLKYSVPEEVASRIDMIHPTTRFPLIKPAYDGIHNIKFLGSQLENINASCNVSITPTCLQNLYNITSYMSLVNSTNLGFVGVVGFLNQYPQYADLVKFQEQMAPWANGNNFTWTSINDGHLDQPSSSESQEANLDIQYITTLTFPLANNFYSTGGLGYLIPDNDEQTQADNQNEPYLELLMFLLNLDDDQLPHTLSVSYGEDEQSVPAQYSQKVCHMFGQLGLRGVSVIFSSGDTGVGSACETNDGKNTTRFMPVFPASCPYVTSVGATQYIEPEVATSFSAGGFSDRWPRSWWQQNHVVNYLENLGDKWAGLYNPWGRGFPDVAAQGSGFRVVDKGQTVAIDGTSCSAPTFASIIALINAAKLQSGSPPLGFLNPWLYLYAYPALNDIIEGGSRGCTGKDMYTGVKTPYVPYASWNATAGWDPVTGLGTPDFQKLLGMAMASFDRHGRRSL